MGSDKIEMRASDFIIMKGISDKTGNAYEFAKVDNRCALMNNKAFIENLRTQGAREFTGKNTAVAA